MKKRGFVLTSVAVLACLVPNSSLTQDRQLEPLVFDDFSSSAPGEFPTVWSWRRDRDTGDAEKARRDTVDVFRYVTREENGNQYLHVRDEHRPGHSVSLYLETKDLGWNLKERPILSWRWRVNEIPAGADERFTETNDSPATVSLVYGKKFPWTPITIKWVWSSTLPVGAVAYRPGRGRAYNIVLGTGTDRLGEWITVERNVYEDYIAIFGKEPQDKPDAIVISSDANRTPGGAADADYDDFKALASYSEGFPTEPFVLLKEYMENNR